MKKNIYFIACILLILLSPTLSMGASFFNKWYQINLNYSEDWYPIPDDTPNRVLSLRHSSMDATVNISAFTYKESGVTVNGFQERRMAANYDGWLHIGSRHGKPSEIEGANASDASLVIYGKKVLNKNLSYQNKIVAEYYFVTENKGYVLSITSLQEKWPLMKGPFKTLVDSFWIGNGERPKPHTLNNSFKGWHMKGQGIENQGHVKASFRLKATPKTPWRHTSKAIKSTIKQVLYTENKIIILTQRKILALSMHDGHVQWSIPNPRNKVKEIALNNHYLAYFSRLQSKGPLKLHITSLKDGSQMVEVQTSIHEAKNIRIYKGHVWAQGQNQIMSFKVDTGLPGVSLPTRISEGLYMVASANTLVLPQDHSISVYNTEKKEMKSLIALSEPLVYAPMVVENYLIISQEISVSVNIKNLEIRAINLDNGLVEWTYNTPYQIFLSSPRLSGEILCFMLQNKEGPYVQSLDIHTGVPVWQYKWAPYKPKAEINPIVTDRAIFLIKEKEGQSLVQSLDNRTGKPITTVTLNNFYPPIKARPLGIYIYKNKLFLHDSKRSVSLYK